MAIQIPTQVRTVDPFASYNSNIVNKLTRMVGKGDRGLLYENAMDVTIDSTDSDSYVVVKPGIAIHDEMLIHFTSEFRLHMRDPEYVIGSASAMDETGYYWIVLDYTYQKSRPAPTASVKIIKPSDAPSYVSLINTTSSSLLFLKAVHVINSGGVNVVDTSDLRDYDPDNSTVERPYLRFYAGSATTLPTFTASRDVGRFVYASNEDVFYVGFSDGWKSLDEIAGFTVIDIDTTGTNVGDICYIDAAGDPALSIATAATTAAHFCVRVVGTAGEGEGIITGYATNIKVETGITISVGDRIFLSDSEAGKVTNVQTSPLYQEIGQAATAGDDTTPIAAIFNPKLMAGGVTSVSGTIASGDWNYDAGEDLYYDDIDISSLGSADAITSNWFDDSTNREISPAEVELTGGGTTVRVYVADNTLDVNYVIR
jgi:hypothetical protein